MKKVLPLSKPDTNSTLEKGPNTLLILHYYCNHKGATDVTDTLSSEFTHLDSHFLLLMVSLIQVQRGGSGSSFNPNFSSIRHCVVHDERLSLQNRSAALVLTRFE